MARSSDFYTDAMQFFSRKKREYPTLILVIALIFVGANFLLFRWIKFEEISTERAAIQGMLRDEYRSANSYAMAKAISDLEKLKILSCSVLTEKSGIDRVFYDTSGSRGCFKRGFFERLFQTQIELSAINGLIYNFKFQTPIRWQSLLLEIFSNILISLFFGVYFWNWKNQKKTHELEVKAMTLEKEIAAQLAHDIRSPLAALDVALKDADSLPEEQRLLVRGATARIRDIANNLLNKNKASDGIAGEGVSSQLLSALVDSIVTEKRLQYRGRSGVEIEAYLGADAFGVFVKVAPNEFKRVISNLVNNSVEALETGQVHIFIRGDQKDVSIEIRDNGLGIPPDLIPKLGNKGVSYGKEEGSGLGLYHARSSFETWGGSLEIVSKLNQGTSIILRLPMARAPRWWLADLVVAPDLKPVVIDDDVSILRVWEKRFSTLGIKTCIHFSSAEEFLDWHRASAKKTNYKYLFDYELLGSRETGLDLITDLHLEDQSVLVTSRFEDKAVQEEVEQLSVKLLPKSLVPYVPITIKKDAKEKVDVILIDDDLMMHKTWSLGAKKYNKTIKCFSAPREFFADAESISHETPIYIDSTLSDGEKGEVVAKDIFDLGFRTIYLATGYRPEYFTSLPWIKGVIGKELPWNVT